jgi:hypothetical protein
VGKNSVKVLEGAEFTCPPSQSACFYLIDIYRVLSRYWSRPTNKLLKQALPGRSKLFPNNSIVTQHKNLRIFIRIQKYLEPNRINSVSGICNHSLQVLQRSREM